MARTGRVKAILFRVFYSTTFTLVFLLTISFAAAGPIDALYQSYRRNRLIDTFIIAGLYLLTAVIAVLLYSTRLYTNRQLLKDIPKTYMPIDKRELGNRRVGRLIEDCRNRANVIGYLARPRARRVEKDVGYAGARIRTLLKPEHSKESRIFEPQWGTISHPGWSSPASRETPNLEYNTVVGELTDLIEARAVSLAPINPNLASDEHGNDIVNESTIGALRRPEEQGMRGYISHLISLDVLDDNSLVVALLTLYERARFAPTPLSEGEFKQLMRMFAEILRTMKPLDMDRLDVDAPDDLDDDDDDDDAINHKLYHQYAVQDASKTSQVAKDICAMASASSLESSIAGSIRHHKRPQAINTNTNTASYITAPPRISHDSVRSVSSSDAHQDAEGKTDASWVEPTSRPPFLRARSSQSRTSARSRGGRSAPARSRVARVGGRRRSKLGRAVSRASIESGGESLKSIASVRSKGSVIRLNPHYDGSREMLPFEYIAQREGNDGASSVRRQLL